jgi:glycosyltransferase involved in cell wall biosynthesis
VEFRRWSLETEISCFDGIAVGLMPLDDTPWARSKCAFKAIQYMALGIPAVASPVGMNVEVICTGENGFLPRSEDEWIGQLDTLLSDRALAARIGAAGREVVEQRYSLRVVSARLIELLAAVIR